jgi:hypothetical protein
MTELITGSRDVHLPESAQLAEKAFIRVGDASLHRKWGFVMDNIVFTLPYCKKGVYLF